MIIQIIGGSACEAYAYHLPRLFCDIAEGMCEDRGVIFDDDKLTEICRTLQMQDPGNWGYKHLPNRVYFGFGPLYVPSDIKVLLKKDVLEPPVREIDLQSLDIERTAAVPDKNAMNSNLEDDAIVVLLTRFGNKDFWADLGDVEFDPSLLSLAVHDLDGLLGTGGLSIIHHVVYGGKPLEFIEGAGDETDYEVKTLDAERFKK